MPNTMSTGILFRALPVAWVFEIDQSANTVTELWTFDNLQSCNYKIPKNPDSSSDSETIDINRADGAIIQFPKEELVIDGTNEEDITGSSGNLTGAGEVTIVANQAPTEQTSFTAFLMELQEKIDSKFLVIIPTGMSYTDTVSSTPDSEGFLYMIGDITSDIEQELSGEPSSVSITFGAAKPNSADDTALGSAIDGITPSAIDWKRGMTSDAEIQPAFPADADDNLIEGKIVIELEA